MTIRAQVDDGGILAYLSGLERRMGNLTPVLAAIGEDVRLNIWQCFESGRDPRGHRWAPLKNPSRRRQGGQILRDTGRLFNSINVLATGKSVVVGTNVGYGAFHQFGTKRVPARPFLPLVGTAEAPVADLPPAWRDSILDLLKVAVTV